jgi:hypothetical protein
LSISVRPAIPASQIVQVNPSVLSAGGNALDLIGLMVTQNTRPPIGQVLSFADATDVGSYFGTMSQEAALASIYFLGPDNSTVKPASLLFAQYAETAVSAYLRGASLAGVPLATLQTYSGSFSISFDGSPTPTTATISLAAATSFSNAAEIIGAGLGIRSGTPTATITASISGTLMTVTGVTSGTVTSAAVVTGTGVSGMPYVVQQISGTTGSTGVYQLSTSQMAASEAMTLYAPAVSYDSISGGFVIVSATTGNNSMVTYASGTLANQLLMTQALGAVISPGAAAYSPGSFMTSITAITQDWASFMTLWEGTDAEKEAFATWNNSQNNRYVYEMWDTSAANISSGGPSAPVAFINSGQLSGIDMIHVNPSVDTTGQLAAFGMGWTASLDFTRLNGRQTQAFKRQTGLQPQVFSGTIANYLISYGMNFYGDYTTANEAFNWWYPGAISGPFLWKDSYVNQIWLNNQLQLAMMVLLDNVGSIPYNQAGYALIEAAALDPINAAVNFGAIRAGVELSQAQIAEIGNLTNIPNASDILFQRGWLFQVVPATAQVRAARGSPPCTLLYCDGGSIQEINIASIEIQ